MAIMPSKNKESITLNDAAYASYNILIYFRDCYEED
jgi:hypothetical protein